MNPGDIERLQIRQGERVTDAHVRKLDSAIQRTAKLSGPGVRQRQLPWGTIISYDGGSGGGGISAPTFRPRVTMLGDRAEVRWTGRGLIGAVTPTIEGKDIFAELADGRTPALVVSRADASPLGEIGIYFRAELNDAFLIQKVEPVALPALPARAPKLVHKLALYVRVRDGRLTYREADDRVLHSSLGFFAASRAPSGTVEPLWWSIL